MSSPNIQGESVRIVRNLAVPVELVYDAWINPKQLARWMGPDGFRVTDAEVDPRVGGSCVIRVEQDDGQAGSFHWDFVEMDPPKKLVFSFAFGGPGEEIDSHRSRLTLEFRELGRAETELTLIHDRLGAAPPGGPQGVTAGWTQATGKLARYLETGNAEREA